MTAPTELISAMVLAATDALFEASLPPVMRNEDGSPFLVHPPVVTAPGEWPGCAGTVRRYESGAVACDAGCVVTPTTDPRAFPEQNPETCTVCGDGVPFHDAEALVACGLTEEKK